MDQALPTTDSWVNSSNMSCSDTQLKNPFCGKFGPAEQFEVFCLAIVSLTGTIGNLMVIFSIILENRIHKHGNMFIVNLAIADLIVVGLYLPTVIANVVVTENALPLSVCRFTGYLITVSCATSVSNLAFISLNRYWVVVRSKSFKRVFSKRNIIFMLIFTWLWPNLIVSPIVFIYGWPALTYDAKMQICVWNDNISVVYNVLLMSGCIFIPVAVILYSYLTIYKFVKKQGSWFRKHGKKTTSSAFIRSKRRSHIHKQMKREINLLNTLAVTVIVFLICWIPYGVVVLFFFETVPPAAKKVVARFALSNSAMNFIVYGVMHPLYRRGYKNLILFIARRKTLKEIRSESRGTVYKKIQFSSLSLKHKEQHENTCQFAI